MLLRSKITAAFLLTSVIPVLLIGVLTYSYVKSSMEKSVFDGIHVVSELEEANLFLYLEELKTITRNFSSDEFIRDSIENAARNTINKKNTSKALSQYLINKAKSNTDILYVDVLNKNSIVTSSTIEERIGSNNIKERYFNKVKDDIYVNDIRGFTENGLEVEFLAPLFSRKAPSKLVGVLVNRYTVNSIKDLFSGRLVLGMGAKSQARGLGETGETYLVNKDRLMINDSLFVEGASFSQVVDTYPVIMSIEKGKEVTGLWKDYRGADVVGSSIIIEIDDFKWTLISEQDADEAFSAIKEIKKSFVIIIIIIMALVFIAAILISRNITRPINILTRELEALGNGEQHKRLNEIESNDEIGFFAQSFERMSLKLNKALDEIQDKNHQLEKLSNRDGLTGLFNHRYLKEILDIEFNRSYRYNEPLCCIMLDIDYFKSINDTYGHLFGDIVLKGVADIIKKGCRKSDVSARYGGEEFIVLLPNTERIQARVVAEKIFRLVAGESYSDGTKQTSITISVGLSFFHDGTKKYSDILEEADKAMYQAKNNGRNKICVFGDDDIT